MANVDIRQGYKNAAWFTANPTLVLKEGQRVNLLQTGTYKLGDGVTALSALSFLGGSTESHGRYINTTFTGSTITLSNTPISNTELLFIDGVLKTITLDYTIALNVITLITTITESSVVNCQFKY